MKKKPTIRKDGPTLSGTTKKKKSKKMSKAPKSVVKGGSRKKKLTKGATKVKQREGPADCRNEERLNKMKRLYKKTKSCAVIAKKFNCTAQAVHHYLKYHGFKMNPRGFNLRNRGKKKVAA